MRNAVALSLLLLGAAARAEEGYTFVLGDERIYPSIVSLEGTPERPRAGDLARIKDVWITLGEPGTYRFRRDENRIFLVGADGAETLVAATMRDDLSREQIRGLRGLRIGHWDDAMKNLAGAIDPATTCVLHLQDDGTLWIAIPAIVSRTSFASRTSKSVSSARSSRQQVPPRPDADPVARSKRLAERGLPAIRELALGVLAEESGARLVGPAGAVRDLAEIRELLAGSEGADADLVRVGLKLVE